LDEWGLCSETNKLLCPQSYIPFNGNLDKKQFNDLQNVYQDNIQRHKMFVAIVDENGKVLLVELKKGTIQGLRNINTIASVATVAGAATGQGEVIIFAAAAGYSSEFLLFLLKDEDGETLTRHMVIDVTTDIPPNKYSTMASFINLVVKYISDNY